MHEKVYLCYFRDSVLNQRLTQAAFWNVLFNCRWVKHRSEARILERKLPISNKELVQIQTFLRVLSARKLWLWMRTLKLIKIPFYLLKWLKNIKAGTTVLTTTVLIMRLNNTACVLYFYFKSFLLIFNFQIGLHLWCEPLKNFILLCCMVQPQHKGVCFVLLYFLFQSGCCPLGTCSFLKMKQGEWIWGRRNVGRAGRGGETGSGGEGLWGRAGRSGERGDCGIYYMKKESLLLINCLKILQVVENFLQCVLIMFVSS